jgi:hypothetical protein
MTNDEALMTRGRSVILMWRLSKVTGSFLYGIGRDFVIFRRIRGRTITPLGLTNYAAPEFPRRLDTRFRRTLHNTVSITD